MRTYQIGEIVVCSVRRSQCQLSLGIGREGRVGAYALTILVFACRGKVGGCVNGVVIVRMQRGAGPWELPSNHQGELTSFLGGLLWICSKETIASLINGRDRLQLIHHSFYYLLLMPISTALHLFDAPSTVEKQSISLLVTHDNCPRRKKRPHSSTRGHDNILLQPTKKPPNTRSYHQT